MWSKDTGKLPQFIAHCPGQVISTHLRFYVFLPGRIWPWLFQQGISVSVPTRLTSVFCVVSFVSFSVATIFFNVPGLYAQLHSSCLLQQAARRNRVILSPWTSTDPVPKWKLQIFEYYSFPLDYYGSHLLNGSSTYVSTKITHTINIFYGLISSLIIYSGKQPIWQMSLITKLWGIFKLCSDSREL